MKRTGTSSGGASTQSGEGPAPTTERDRGDMAAGTFSRGAAVKALMVGLAGGLASRFGLPAPDAEARKRQLSTLWGAFNSDGTIVNSRGVDRSQSEKIGTGAYIVFFTRDVTRCALTASINLTAGPSMISVTPLGGQPKAVQVNTNDAQGTTVNRAFSVLVTC